MSRTRSAARKSRTRRLGPGLVVLAAMLLALGALAQGFREFSGTIHSVSPREIVVQNRQGDRLAFVRGSTTVVSGSRSRWSELARDDSVRISWRLEDDPPVAHEVRVR